MKAVSLLLALACLAGPAAAQGYHLRIGLIQGASSVTILVDPDTRILDLSTREVLLTSTGTLKATSPRGGRLRVGGRIAYGSIEVSHPSGRVRLNGQDYPGRLVLRSAKGGLTAINDLDIETYLEGVLPHEMSPSWPIEALRAQAVVSRTFAVYNLGQFHQDGFDLAADLRSQVYKGLRKADPRIREAVQSTRDQVLTYRGKVLNAYFHSTCGGHTRSAYRAWRGLHSRIKPLKGVVDTHCRISPHWRWKTYFSGAEILRAVQASGAMVTRVLSLSIGKRERSGYVSTFVVKTDEGRVKISGVQLRKALGPAQLKSTRIFRIVRKGKGWLFDGGGFGHGVGLCQWGARAQAQHGRAYRRILDFYYPGSRLRQLDGTR